MDLDEYWLMREDTMDSRLRAYEERMMREFVGGLKHPNQRAAMTDKLNKYGWTRASAKSEIEALHRKEKKREEAQARAQLNAAETTSGDEL